MAASASTRFLSCEVAGRCFTGTVMGLYALAQEKQMLMLNLKILK